MGEREIERQQKRVCIPGRNEEEDIAEGGYGGEQHNVQQHQHLHTKDKFSMNNDCFLLLLIFAIHIASKAKLQYTQI